MLQEILYYTYGVDKRHSMSHIVKSYLKITTYFYQMLT